MSTTVDEVYTYFNGIQVYRRHLNDVQVERYSAEGNPNLHEPVEESWFLRVIDEIGPGFGCFMDIGAAIGYYDVLVRKHVPGARIYAIEALEQHCSAFWETLELNQVLPDGVTLAHAAVSECNGQVEFLDSGYGSLVARNARPGQYSNTITVPSYTLAHFVEQAGGRIDLAKMDIQGTEAIILYSSAPVLASGAVYHWIIGTHSAEIHQACLRMLSKYYDILYEDPAPDMQPDGIVVARYRCL